MRPDTGLDPLRTLFGELLARGGGGGENGVLASMVSAQDTVLPPRAADPSPWEGRFLANTELTTAQGRTDVIRLLAAGRPLLLLSDGADGADSARWQAQARPWSGLLRVVRTGADSALPGGAVLLRPDGYVGWAAGAAPSPPPWAPTSARAAAGNTDNGTPTPPPPAPAPAPVRARART